MSEKKEIALRDALIQIAKVEQSHCYQTEEEVDDLMQTRYDLRKCGDLARAALRPEPQEAPHAEIKPAHCAHDPELPCDLKCDARNECASQLVKPVPIQSVAEFLLDIWTIGKVKVIELLEKRDAAQHQAGREEAIQECNACSEMILADERSIVAEKLQAHYSAVVKATRELNEAVKKLPANDGRICGLIPIITRVDDALIDLDEIERR